MCLCLCVSLTLRTVPKRNHNCQDPGLARPKQDSRNYYWKKTKKNIVKSFERLGKRYIFDHYSEVGTLMLHNIWNNRKRERKKYCTCCDCDPSEWRVLSLFLYSLKSIDRCHTGPSRSFCSVESGRRSIFACEYFEWRHTCSTIGTLVHSWMHQCDEVFFKTPTTNYDLFLSFIYVSIDLPIQ